MKELTDEQFEQLTSFEIYFDTAINSNYVRAIPMKDAKLLADIYKALGCGSTNLSCGKCVLQLCKTLGKLYFEYKNN